MTLPTLRKPTKAERVRDARRAKRAETRHARLVRAEVEARDGYCRLSLVGLGACAGPSEWSHLRKRSLTRNLPPGVRHNTQSSVMHCRRHHQLYEAHIIKHIAMTKSGADGLMIWKHRDGFTYVEA